VSVNRHLPHVFVLPEDDANKDLFNGFLLGVDSIGQVRVLRVAGGWNEVLKRFEADHVMDMDRWPKRFMVLLIDFDRSKDRLEKAKAVIPKQLADRVFVLGAWSEPEALRAALGLSYERIGLLMADDCREETDTTWRHNLLRHNTDELERMREHVRPILF
jgi:hypothetical protein